MLVLASTSPRRAKLLDCAGISFTTLSTDIDESWHTDETAESYIYRMVHQKADKASHLMGVSSALILTADTIGVLPTGEVLTKPIDKKDAFEMWDKLSGTTHEIWTAVCLTYLKDGQKFDQKTIKITTKVNFIHLTCHQKERYWATGEPKDKAGAYAIQGGAMAWVKEIDGSYTNVVGLPLAQTLALIDEFCMRHNIGGVI